MKHSQEHLREPGELIQKQSKDYLREKNNELIDALIAQERVAEKFKWELKKTAEAYESECKRTDLLKRDNQKFRQVLEQLRQKQKFKIDEAPEKQEIQQTIFPEG